jgi:hypothetical protein
VPLEGFKRNSLYRGGFILFGGPRLAQQRFKLAPEFSIFATFAIEKGRAGIALKHIGREKKRFRSTPPFLVHRLQAP